MPKNGWFFAGAWLLCWGLAPDGLAATSPSLRPGSPYTVDKKWDTDTEDGLPNNEVIAMTQTRDGYLWLGTLNGLVRFDGIHFTVFDENNTPGLNSSRIVSLFEDSQTNLWIGTETAGIARLKDGQVTSAPETASGGAQRRLAAACEDAKGAVWLYLANGELWRYWNRSYTLFTNFLYESRCRTLIAEPGGPVWAGTDHRQRAIDPMDAAASLAGPDAPESGVGKLDFLLASQQGGYWRLAEGRVQRGTNYVERDLGPYPWGGTPIAAACEDREGNLVVGTLGAGVFRFDSEGNVSPLSTSEGLSLNHILSLHVDREGTLWVGTDGGGLNRVKRKVFDVLERSRGLVVQSLYDDGEGGFWLGANGGELGHFKNGALRGIRTGQDDPSVKAIFADRNAQGQLLLLREPPSVRAIFEDKNTNVWVGTVNAGLFQLQSGWFLGVPGPEPIRRVVGVIHQDRSGRLWFGTRGGLVRWDGTNWHVFTTTNGLTSDVVTAIADEPDGSLWVGTAGGGLSRLRGEVFTSFCKEDGLTTRNISSLCLDADGVLWVGTDGSGLARFHDGKWTRYTIRDGLVSNSIGYLIEDGEGYLWLGSNRGLMRAPKKALNDFSRNLTRSILIRAYGQPDGLPTRECTLGSQPAACRTRDGKLWFPTTKGLAFIDPAQLRRNTNPPPVAIESVLVEGQEQNTNGLHVTWPQPVIIPAGKERLEIQFTSLNLAAPERARFRYRLQEHESAWTEAGNNRVVLYSKLPPPGHYRFQVTACNEDGVWNETGSILPFIVEPPFWSTWWFLTATSACLIGTISGVVYFLSTQRLQRQLERLKQQEALEKERARIARDIHDQLGASLTQVSLLGEFVESDKDSPADVEAHARQICQTARDTTRVLDEIVWTVNPSNDTLDGLVNYICKYAQDYLAVAGLRYRLDVPPQLPDASIPPELRHNVFLAAKEAVTNVVRHARASAVWVRLKLQPGTFTLEIEDNGRGLAGMDEKAASSRNGLRNMRKRMEDIGGSFTMTAATEGGTLVRLSAPLANGKPK